MPEPSTDQGGAVVNRQNHAIEKRNTPLEEDQQLNQDSRLREQSFETTGPGDPDRSQEKRKHMEISL